MNVNSKKRRRRTDICDDFEDKYDDKNEMSEHTEVLLIRQIIDDLSAKLRDVLILCEVQGLTASEAAAVLNISQNTVSSRLRLGRQEFKKKYNALHKGGSDAQ